MNEKLIYSKDIHSDQYEGVFARIKEENHALYLHLITNMERSSSVGVREDILSYFSDHAKAIPEDERYLFHLVNYACNPIMTVDQLVFVDDYFNHNVSEQKFSIDDFAVVFSACVEKNISLSEIKDLFFSGKDVMEIYESVDNYISMPKDDLERAESFDIQGNEEVIERNPSDNLETIQPLSEDMGNASDVDMFNTLITLMTVQNKDDITAINVVQDKFADVLKQIQTVTSNLSVFSSEFVNSMKKDKEEIKRLDAMIKLMQKLLASKQYEISELRGEVASLNARIRTFESAELRRDTLNQKISEVYSLALSADQEHGQAHGGFISTNR